MKKVKFVTTNRQKFAEVQDVLKNYPVELTQMDAEYPENHDDSLRKIAIDGARYMLAQLNEPVIVEDTGIFFEAYENFPGALPKFVFKSIGFEGIFRLLDGKIRKAYFETVAAYAEPGEEVQVFKGRMNGQITEEVFNEKADVMPYDYIFMPEGSEVTISEMTKGAKNKISQRAVAFRKFGDYISKKL